MMRRLAGNNRLLVLLALLPLACGRVQGDQEGRSMPPYELSAEEIRMARELAERDLIRPEDVPSPGDKTVFTRIELIPDTRAETIQRMVIVTHYRYRDDVAVLTTVDLNTRQVLKVEHVPHFPTPLATEELARATELARADVRLADLWAAHGPAVQIEGKVGYAASERDPTFGRRTVYLLFRVGANYLTRPRVVVDLTGETVQVE